MCVCMVIAVSIECSGRDLLINPLFLWKSQFKCFIEKWKGKSRADVMPISQFAVPLAVNGNLTFRENERTGGVIGWCHDEGFLASLTRPADTFGHSPNKFITSRRSEICVRQSKRNMTRWSIADVRTQSKRQDVFIWIMCASQSFYGARVQPLYPSKPQPPPPFSIHY